MGYCISTQRAVSVAVRLVDAIWTETALVAVQALRQQEQAPNVLVQAGTSTTDTRRSVNCKQATPTLQRS